MAVTKGRKSVASQTSTLKVGDAAPDFSLPRADHTAEVTLSAFRGKQPVVLSHTQ